MRPVAARMTGLRCASDWSRGAFLNADISLDRGDGCTLVVRSRTRYFSASEMEDYDFCAKHWRENIQEVTQFVTSDEVGQ